MAARMLCFVPSLASLPSLACVLVDGVMQVLAERRAERTRNLPPLPDLAHSVLPYIRWWKLNDLYMALFAAAFVLRFVAIKRLRVKVLRRFLFLQGVILLCRGISVVLTTLSIPLENCVSDATGNPFLESLLIFIYVKRTCSDLLFSGHTATYTLFALFWTHYSRGQEWKACGVSQQMACASATARCPCCSALAQAPPAVVLADCSGVWLGLPASDAVGDPSTFHWAQLLVWLFHLLGLFFILATHFHYSVDVYIGFVLTALTFHLYHYYVKASLEANNYTAAFFRWFEAIRVRGRRQSAEGETVEGAEGGGEGDVGGEATSVLYGVSMVDGLNRKRPEEVGPLPLASAIADLEHREHVIVTGEQPRQWY